MSRCGCLLLAGVLAACGSSALPGERPGGSWVEAPALPEVARGIGEGVGAAAARAGVGVVGEGEPPADFSFSRFAPQQGLVGTRIRVAGYFPGEPRDYVVTVGGTPALIVAVRHTLEVEVAPGTVSGPLCIANARRSQCTSTFTVLEGPVAYYVSPQSLPVGTSRAAIAVQGDGFTPTSVVHVEGAPLPTTPRSGQTLEAWVPPELLLTAGTLAVTVVTPTAAQPASAAVPFTVTNPGPSITQVIRWTARDGVTILSVSGAGFVPTSVVWVELAEVATTYLSPNQLEVRLSPTAGRIHDVRVANPPPGGGWTAPVAPIGAE